MLKSKFMPPPQSPYRLSRLGCLGAAEQRPAASFSSHLLSSSILPSGHHGPMKQRVKFPQIRGNGKGQQYLFESIVY